MTEAAVLQRASVIRIRIPGPSRSLPERVTPSAATSHTEVKAKYFSQEEIKMCSGCRAMARLSRGLWEARPQQRRSMFRAARLPSLLSARFERAFDETSSRERLGLRH